MADDNRIRLDETPVNFSRTTQTGQLHDSFPLPRTQARYDQIRSYLIGLLANQSSEEPPFETRTGALWFNTKINALMINVDDNWVNLDQVVMVNDGTDEDTVITLSDFATEVRASLQYVAPRIVYGGFFTRGVNNIPIPEKYQGFANMQNMQPFLYVDGLLIDPRLTQIQPGSPAYIKMADSVDVRRDQKYTVIIEHVTDLLSEDIVAQGK